MFLLMVQGPKFVWRKQWVLDCSQSGLQKALSDVPLAVSLVTQVPAQICPGVWNTHKSKHNTEGTRHKPATPQLSVR